MTDIVKRLREGVYDQDEEKMLTDLLYDGADEIVKLRGLLKRFVEDYDKHHMFRTADQHRTDCDCMRCVRDAAYVEINYE